jgi:choice-of-anchor C domain-containing protein
MGRSGKWSRVFLISSFSAFISTAGYAQTVLNNRSFETGTAPGATANLAPGSTAIEAWTVVDGQISYVGNRWQHAQGERSVGLMCGGGITQMLATEPGMKYEIRFNMAGDPTAKPALKTLRVSFGETRVFTFDTTGHSLTEMGWAQRTWIFTANADKTPLTFTSPKSECSVPAIDSIRIEAVEIGVRNHQEGVRQAERTAGED